MKQWISNGVEFKEGDVVRVVRFVEDDDPDGMGEGIRWDNGWVEEMDKFLGLPMIIEGIDEEGVYFEGGKGASFGFPLKSLEKIS